MKPVTAFIIATAVLAGLTAAQADALQFDPLTYEQRAAPDQPYTVEGFSTDVVGINLGVSASAVNAGLSASGYKMGKQEKVYDSFGMIFDGLSYTFSSSDYLVQEVYRLESNDWVDEITVYYGSPLTGAKVQRIDRVIQYPKAERRPPVADTNIGILAKYGKPNAKNSSENSNGGLFCWTYSDQKREAQRVCDPGDDKVKPWQTFSAIVSGVDRKVRTVSMSLRDGFAIGRDEAVRKTAQRQYMDSVVQTLPKNKQPLTAPKL